jgi:hypothetical protein
MKRKRIGRGLGRRLTADQSYGNRQKDHSSSHKEDSFPPKKQRSLLFVFTADLFADRKAKFFTQCFILQAG